MVAVPVLFGLVLLVPAARAQDPGARADAHNLDFEQGQPGEVPNGWWVDGEGYTIAIEGSEAYDGTAGAELRRASSGPEEEWGWLCQTVSAEPYRGSWVRVSAGVRVDPGGSTPNEARLYAEVFGPDVDARSKDLMEQRPIFARDWYEYAVYAWVPPDADLFQFGVTYAGDGRVLVDGFSLERIGEFETRPVEARGPWGLDYAVAAEGEVPWPWVAPDEGVEVGVILAGGERELMIRAREDATSLEYGTVVQYVPAEPWRGRRVRLRTSVQLEGIGEDDPWAAVYFHAGPEGERTPVFSSSQEEPIRPGQRVEIEIVGNVVRDYDSMEIGLMLFGPGRVRMGTLSFEDLGSLEALREPDRSIEDEGLANLVAFARLFGYVRHFHPSDEAAAADWNELARRGVREVESADSPGDLLSRLEALFAPVAPSVWIGLEGEEPVIVPELHLAEGDRRVRVVTWIHEGYGDGGPYSNRRSRRVVKDGVLPDGFIDPAEPFVASLGRGLACAVPLSVYRDRDGTLPRAEARGATEPWVPDLESGGDRGARLACVVLGWNVLQHFYPYFDVVDADWGRVLVESLSHAADDSNREEFLDTLARMLAELDDGHARVMHPSIDVGRVLPIGWDLVEGQVVVSHVLEHSDDLFERRVPRPGDVLESIDGVPALDALRRVESRVSGATAGWVHFRGLLELTAGESDGSLLTLRAPDGRRYETRSLRPLESTYPTVPRPPPLEELEPGLYYVDLTRLSDDDFEGALDDLARAQAIVFDMRGYPDLQPKFLSHLADEPLRSPRWEIPRARRPDRLGLEFDSSDWELQPAEPRFTARVVFLTDASAISYAETCMQIVAHYGLGTIVGARTAGTNGNVTFVSLPGGYILRWTGMRVRKQDGSTYHGVGVVPDLPVERTIAGIAAGRDELLEAALAAARR